MASVNPGIGIDYTSKDYQGFMDSMLGYATAAFPEWTNQNPGSLEIMLLESFAREMDVLSYYGDRAAAEAYIGTATQLSSVIRLAQLLGYTPGQPIAATGNVTFETDDTQATSVIVPAGTQVTTQYVASLNAPIVYETVAAVTVPATGGNVVAQVVQGEMQGSVTFAMGHPTGNDYSLLVEPIGTSDGAILQEYTLSNNPVIGGSVAVYLDNPAYNPTALINTVEPLSLWFEVPTLMDAIGTDTAWAQSTDENGVVSVTFGDDINGAVPPAGLNIYASYRVGGGTIGNVAANQIVDIASPLVGVSVASSSAMTGGANAESIDQIRVNAPRAYRTQDRAVTLKDFGNLALGVSSVSQANAVANTYTNVTVYITAVGNTTPTQGLLDVVTDYLQDRAMAGATVTAQAASFVSVNIGSVGTPVVVGCDPRYNPTAIQTRATQAIQSLFDPARVVFGQRLSVSSVYAAVNDVPGVSYVVIPLMARSDAAQSGTADVICRAWEIPVAGNIVVTATAS
jgi:hypothetical protein